MSGTDLLAYMRHLTRAVFGFDLDDHQRAADRKLYGFVSDHRTGALTPLFGDPDGAVVELLNRPGVRLPRVAAGFQAAVRKRLSGLPARLDSRSRDLLTGLAKDFDVFAVADDVLSETEALVRAITFHETCHLVEQGGHTVAFAVEPDAGRELLGSLPDPAFRQNHSRYFCDLLTAAAARVYEVGEPFADELDVISHAMHYEYDGDPWSTEGVIRAAVRHHVGRGNQPTFFDGDYLPRIDALYRILSRRAGNFVPVPGSEAVVQGRYKRPCYVLEDRAYRDLAGRV